MKTEEAIMKRIEQIKVKCLNNGMLLYGGTNNSPPSTYIFPMDNMERQTNEYLKEIKDLITETTFDKTFYEGIEAEFIELLYEMAMKREEFAWAATFSKRRGRS